MSDGAPSPGDDRGGSITDMAWPVFAAAALSSDSYRIIAGRWIQSRRVDPALFDAEDAIQETLLRLARQPRGDADDRPAPASPRLVFLWTLKRVVIDEYRKQHAGRRACIHLGG